MEKETLESIENEVIEFIRRMVITDKDRTLDRSAFMILRQLHTYGPAGVKLLAEQLALDISTVSRQAASLADKQYVNKAPHPDDRRAYFYRITEEGSHILQENKQRRLAVLERALHDWSNEDGISFARLLSKYNEAVNREREQ